MAEILILSVRFADTLVNWDIMWENECNYTLNACKKNGGICTSAIQQFLLFFSMSSTPHSQWNQSQFWGTCSLLWCHNLKARREARLSHYVSHSSTPLSAEDWCNLPTCISCGWLQSGHIFSHAFAVCWLRPC